MPLPSTWGVGTKTCADSDGNISKKWKRCWLETLWIQCSAKTREHLQFINNSIATISSIHHQSIDHILHFATIVFNHPHCQQQPSSSSQCPPPPPPYHHHDPKIIQTRSITLCKQPPSLTALPSYIDSSSSQNRFAQEYNQQCAAIPSYEYNPRCSLLLLLLLHTAATIYFYFYFCIYNTTATSSYSRCHHPLHFTITNSSDHSLAGLGFVVHLKYGFRDQCGMYAWWSLLVDSETVEHHHHLLHISWREVLA